MKTEHIVKALPLDENLQAEANKLEADGWQLSITPVVIYHLHRNADQPSPGLMLGKLKLDDRFVHIVNQKGEVVG